MARLTLALAFTLPVLSAPLLADAPAPPTVREAFDTPLTDHWKALAGEWQAADGALHGTGTGDLMLRGRWWRDVEVEVTLAIPEAEGPPYWAGIRLRRMVTYLRRECNTPDRRIFQDIRFVPKRASNVLLQ